MSNEFPMTDNVIHPDCKEEQAANRRLATWIGIGGFGALGLCYILSVGVMLVAPGLMFRFFPMPTIIDTALSDGARTYLVQQKIDMSTVDPRRNTPPRIKHFLSVLNGAEPGPEREIPAHEHASGNGNRLLFVSEGSYRIHDGTRWNEERSEAIGADPVGLLAPPGVYVLSNLETGPHLTLFADGKAIDLPLPAEYLAWYRNEQCPCACAKLVWHLGRLSLFWKETSTLSWAILYDATWSPASTWPMAGGYDVLADDRAIYLFQREGQGPNRRLTLTVFTNDAWSPPVTLPLKGEFANWDVFLQQGQPKLFTQHIVSSTLATIENGALVNPIRLKGPLDFSAMLGGWVIFWTVGSNVVALLVIVGVSAVVVRCKKRFWQAEEAVYEFATLSRRFAALMIDKLILLIPPGLIAALTLRNLDELDTNPFAFILPIFAALILFFVGSFLYHSLLEGLCGQTLGKKLCGIRVLKADFSPCGLSAAFLRNLLRLADGFFYYLVAVVALAANLKWQRIGDQAAETVVVRMER